MDFYLTFFYKAVFRQNTGNKFAFEQKVDYKFSFEKAFSINYHLRKNALYRH